MTTDSISGQSRIETFVRATANAVPNSEASRAAQSLFKQAYMGLTPQDHGHLLRPFPPIKVDERPFLQAAFLKGLQELIVETGNTPEPNADTPTLIRSLPEKMRHTVHKVGLECGMSQPR